MKVTLNHLQQLYKSGYSLDIAFFLIMIEEGNVIKEACEGNLKLEALYQSVLRKGLITTNDKLTLSGKQVIDYLNTKEEDVKFVKKKDVTKFESWWAVYPSTDTFSYKNKVFSGTRSLKAKKEDCKIKFNKILDEGDYTVDELIKALQFEVDQKKENSIKTGANKLSYMQNSLTYLNQRTYESFIDLIKQGIVIEDKPNYDGVNI
jgi:hypothetical protein